MDNMLYIIAGLIIILLLVVLVMRKNKARRPPVVDRKVDRSQARPSPTMDRSIINQNTPNSPTAGVTKFDNVTIAQRFIDQQRYDKAIETLERGLAEKPYDGPLLLKLLDVYIATNQTDDFYRTYNTIQTHSDQFTIEQAQQLKNSMGGQHSDSIDNSSSMTMALETNAAMHADPVTPATPSHIDTLEQDDFSLDFDTSYPATDENNPVTAVETINNEQNSDSFDLTLDDLEATDLGDINETLAGSSNDKFTDTQPVVSADTISQPTANIDDDFTFDFDDIDSDNDSDNFANNTTNNTIEAHNNSLTNDKSEDAALIADNSLATSASSPTDELSLDDDFVIDLQDFATDPNIQNEADIEISSSNEASALESDMDDFVFSLDDSDTVDEPTSNSIDTDLTSSASTGILGNQTKDIVFDFDEQLADDDAWLIDDNFISDFDNKADVNPVIASAPADIELSTESPNNLAPVDFDSQFSADFNFVKSLDSHQVTLDLADQYLQLGEYDSAKRLLTEVVNQGSSEQQQKAQALLARTT